MTPRGHRRHSTRGKVLRAGASTFRLHDATAFGPEDSMRTHTFRLFAIVSMLALLFGAQVCMLVQCSPAHAAGVVHSCCAKAAARSANGAPAPHESAKPCCIQATVASAPALEPPATAQISLFAAIVVAAQLAAAPIAACTSSPPGDDRSPTSAPPAGAAGSRAPPLA